jgi:hypothetical protein
MKKRTSSSKPLGHSGVTHGRMKGPIPPHSPHENYIPPNLSDSYIVREPRRYINGENFIIPQDEMDALMDACVARAKSARAKTLCQHPAWTVWAIYDGDTDQRQCLTCGKKEYK